MMKFHSTGEYFKKYQPEIKNGTTIPQIAQPVSFSFQKYQLLQISQDKSARMMERNFIDSSKFNFKPITTQTHNQQAYTDQINRLNNSYQNKLIFYDYINKYLSQFFPYQNKKPSEPVLNIITGELSNKIEVNFYSPNHIQNFNMMKSRHWANQLPQPSCENKGKIVNNDAYKSENNLNFQKTATHLNRTNLFVTNLDKQFRINNDFVQPSYIRDKRAIRISTQSPDWYQSTNKFYLSDNALSQKQLKFSKNNIKKDIFGSEIKVQNQKADIFKILTPTSDMHYVQFYIYYKLLFQEGNRMLIQDKEQSYAGEHQRTKHVCYKWPEQLDYQKYDASPISKKIGSTPNPYIKFLEQQRKSQNLEIKIGSEMKQPIKKDKLTQLKIGHGQPEILTYKC